MKEKFNIIICIIVALFVTIINIVRNINLLEASLNIILAVIITFVAVEIAKIYLNKTVFIKDDIDIEKNDIEELELLENIENTELDNEELKLKSSDLINK